MSYHPQQSCGNFRLSTWIHVHAQQHWMILRQSKLQAETEYQDRPGSVSKQKVMLNSKQSHNFAQLWLHLPNAIPRCHWAAHKVSAGVSSGATEKCLPYHLEIVSLNLNAATAICSQKPKRTKLAVLCGRGGILALPLSITSDTNKSWVSVSSWK